MVSSNFTVRGSDSKANQFLLGNFVGPLIFRKEDAPRYYPGFIIVVVTSLVAGVLAIVYRLVCMWDNHRRNKSGTTEGFDNAYDDDLTDLKVKLLTDFIAFDIKMLIR